VQRLTDYCKWCFEYKKKQIPAFRDALGKARADLERLYAGYWDRCWASDQRGRLMFVVRVGERGVGRLGGWMLWGG
jgi:hypothetical protein